MHYLGEKTMVGKFIVLYGVNNVGKTTQAQMLKKRLITNGIKTEYLKYALYNLEPSGPLLDEYLRKQNPHNFSAREFQILQVLNRTQFDEQLYQTLKKGTWIIAEDYVGTGIAWGVGSGVNLELLELLNSHLIREDCAIYLSNKRFLEALEKNHVHENNEELIKSVQKTHDYLAQKYNWIKIDANLTDKCKEKAIEQIHEKIWQIIKKMITH